MTAVKTSPMVVNDPPCLPLNHEIDAHVNMTPQDAQMTFPVFAPKMPSAPTTAGRTSSMVLKISRAFLYTMKLTLMST